MRIKWRAIGCNRRPIGIKWGAIRAEARQREWNAKCMGKVMDLDDLLSGLFPMGGVSASVT